MQSVELTHIYKSFGKRPIFLNFSCAFHANSINIVFSAAKKGKTTLLMMAAGLMEPDFGNIKRVAPISMAFADDRLVPHLNALDNCLLSSALPKKKEAFAMDMLGRLHLKHMAKAYPKDLSPCESRRLSLCRALIADYELLILDEPLLNLDKNIIPIVLEQIKQHSRGKICIIATNSTHYLKELRAKMVYLPEIRA